MVTEKLYILYNFTRLGAFGFTALLPLLGASSNSSLLSLVHLILLLIVSYSFHAYAYILNDIIDLPLDRTQPQRAHFPLVKGQIIKKHAIILAFSQVPLALMLTCLITENPFPYISLGIAFIFMSIYNLYGKKVAWPPLTDAAQGCSWGCLVLYGATLSNSHISPVTISLFLYIVVFTLIVNGVQGGIRDLRYDSLQKVNTTAIFLGSKVINGKFFISFRLIIYSIFLQTMLILISFILVIYQYQPYSQKPWVLIIVIGSFLNFANCFLLFAPMHFINSQTTVSILGVYTAPTSVVLGIGYVVASMTLLWIMFLSSKNVIVLVSIAILYLFSGISTYLAAQYEHKNKIEKAKVI